MDAAVFLEHHGIKGQKWGIRNTKASTPSDNKKNNSKHFHFTKKEALIGSSVLVGLAAAAVVIHNKGLTPVKIMKQGFEESNQGRQHQTLVQMLLAKHGDS